MNAPTQLAESFAIDVEESKCLIRSKTEIIFLLRSIMKHNALITAYFNGGKEFILTSIVSVDPESGTLALDLGPDEEMNHRLLNSDRILFTTTHEQVKVKFSSSRIIATSIANHASCRMAIPSKMVRMQRREYYRIGTSVVKPLKCRITLPIDGVATVAEVTVLDISCGGVALIDQHHSVDLEPGNLYQDCQITLPGLATVTAGLRVCNTYETTLRNGLSCKRSGCEFVGIQESARGLIQRYITQLEREFNAKARR